MDDVKHPHTNTARQIDLASIRHCLQKGDARLALQYCHELLADDPQHIQTLLFAVLASRSLGWLDEALNFINRSLALAPNQPAIHSLMGDILLLQKRPEQALSALLQAKELGDGSSQISFNIGSAYLALARYEDAKIYFDQALAIDSLMVAAHVNKGLAEHSLMNLDAALRCFDAALCIEPSNIDAQWNKSHVLLTLGRYEEGFRLYETRWRHPQIDLKKRKFDSKLWLGKEPLAGKTILLYAEGGFGDTIQFIRYAKLFGPDIKLIIQCQLLLIELVRGMRLGAEVIAPGDTPPPHDFHCPLMSLPLAFGTTIETVPRFDQYMYADPDQLKVWNNALRQIKGPKIGIMVEGGNGFANDQRGVCLTDLAQFLPRSFNYVLMHKNVNETELAFLRTNENWLSPCPTFSEAAAICQTLDSVISIDTSMAHLSAALGIPTTVLLPFRPDWRWAHSGSKTPWYPSAKLVRQSEHGSWGDVLSNWHNDCLQTKSSNRRD
jgi:tetratricopeptide (TPR) repeat protein